jgi:hypothetical protein
LEAFLRRTTIGILLLFLLAPGQFGFARSASETAPATDKDAAMQAERTIEDRELTPVEAQSCKSESSLKSLNGDTRTFLRFRNKTTRTLTYYWIDYEGKRDQERTLKPGEEYSLWTYVTHPFVVVNAKGVCSAVYMPRKEYGLVVISEAPK